MNRILRHTLMESQNRICFGESPPTGVAMQLSFGATTGAEGIRAPVRPFRTQLLKWIGNKQRFAHEIIEFFPGRFGTYLEPFLGSGAVLGTLAPPRAVGADILEPLLEIWRALNENPQQLKEWYRVRHERLSDRDGKVEAYEEIKADYNNRPNGADLLFVVRSCYGGVVRFRKDGYLSTPCGSHAPISPESFARRVDIWHERTRGAEFLVADFEETLDRARRGDIVYCDPPYSCTQSILYGAQSFSLRRLFAAIERCKIRGARVVLSIDGSKRSGGTLCDVPIPSGLFEREVMVNCGRSMLRRFQRRGETLEDEIVKDRLLLSY